MTRPPDPEVVRLRAEIDRLDCTRREGGDVRHCPPDRLCLRCDWERRGEALEYVGEMIQQVPPGCDEEADEDDPSPSDAVAHIGGLILRRVRAALKGGKP